MPTKTKTKTNPKPKAPKGTRKPADRKPKKSAPLTCTVRGIDITVAPDALDDWELMEVIAAVDSGDQAATMQMPAVVRRLLGDATYAQVKDALRDEAGRVRAEVMGEFIGELFTELAPNS